MSTLDKLQFPNIKKIFIPDPGKVWFEADLKGADAQVVAWEADDEDLKQAFKQGLDVHAKNAEDMLGSQFSKLSHDDPERKRLRDRSKRSVHAANYLVSARTLAGGSDLSVYEAERFIARWFQLHPKIKQWHNRIERSLTLSRSVSNAFGYTRIYYDRLDQCMTQAVAWIPQSTVALVTYYGAVAVEEALPALDPFHLQVHDSLIFQLSYSQLPMLAQIGRLFHTPVPYPEPLIIPWELKASCKSWGECKAWTWDKTSPPPH